MGKINILETSLANMIAAGEVVERPSSVIKELIENSIDADSQNITIHLFEAGKTKIIVEDDGEGMDREDALLAFKRHATSKISSTFDLFRIKTLGFRGEALPSIASVAKITLVTSKGVGVGTKIIINGEEMEINDAPLRKGTTFIVEELFYNTPARLKYLKADYSENASSVEMVIKLALSHPEIAFTLYIDDKLQFKTSGRGQLLEVIANIYGLSAAENMIPFNFQTSDMTISGYLGKPEIAKSSRYYIFTLLNGRVVYMPKLQNAITDAYHDFLISTKFPFVILDINVDCSLVDVNVHPSKKEVRFSKEDELRRALLEAIPEALKKATLVKEVMPTTPREKIKEERYVQETIEFTPKPKIDIETIVRQQPNEQLILADINQELVQEEVDDVDIPQHKENKLGLVAIGQIAVSYIVADKIDDGFYLIDQHAAMERVNYEKFQKIFTGKLQTCEPLIPCIVTISPNEAHLFTQQKQEMLESIGLTFEPFGLNAFKVTRTPLWLKEYDEKEYIDEIVEQLLHGDKVDVLKLRTFVIATLACKSSLKANHRLSLQEMQAVIERLGECENPSCCPHGRPTMIHFSKVQLEKLFKRRQ